PDAWEVAHGLSPLVANAFEDADGDRYPNIYEYVNSTDPQDRASVPTPNYVVDGSGGGTHTTLNAAFTAAAGASGMYPIIGIAPGVYTGSSNVNQAPPSTKSALVIGLQGAGTTIIDGANSNYGLAALSSSVISSLTIRNTWQGVNVNAAGKEVRLVDLL